MLCTAACFITWTLLLCILYAACFVLWTLLLHILYMLCTAAYLWCGHYHFVPRALLLHILYVVVLYCCMFVPYALLLHILHIVYYHMFCAMGTATSYYYMLCTTECFVPRSPYITCLSLALLLYFMESVALCTVWCILSHILCALLLYICCMLCTDVCLGYGYWCYIISYAVTCCVPWVLPLCAVNTAALYVACCVMPCVFCLRHSYFTYLMLCTTTWLYCGYCCVLCMYVVLLHALCHGHCCFMYCMWCVSTTDLLLHCANRHDYFLYVHVVLVCTTPLYDNWSLSCWWLYWCY